MPVIDEFMNLCERAKELHKKKNDDYAEETDKFFNFNIQAQFIKMFERCSYQDQAFASLVGLKVARLAQLLQEGRQAKNESVDDSFEDLFIYVGLWAAWNKRRRG